MSLDKESFVVGLKNSAEKANLALEALTVSENGDYNAPTGTAYDLVKVRVDKGAQPSGTIVIGENGTYDVTSFESAEVSVGGFSLSDYLSAGLPEVFFCDVTDAPSTGISKLYVTAAYSMAFRPKVHIFPHGNPFYVYNNAPALKTAILGDNVGWDNYKACQNLKTLVMLGDTLRTMGNVNSLLQTKIASGGGDIYVPDSLVLAYKAATNWISYEPLIKGYSAAPAFSLSESYDTGDICLHGGRLYVCVNPVSPGSISPGGDTDENWHFLAEVN